MHLKTFGEYIPPEAAEVELLGLAELVRITEPAQEQENTDE